MLLNPYRFGGLPSALLTSLISYWKLDEASGNALDSHGANPLTDTNTVASAAGKVGNARDFTPAANEYFVKSVSGADLSTGDIGFTFSVWVRPDALGNQTIIGKWSPGPQEFSFYYSGSAFTFLVSGGQTIAAPGAAAAGVWYHVVFWHDPVADQIGISVNNGTPATISKFLGLTAQPTMPFMLGGYNLAGQWDGLIDEVGFWKRMLTPAERAELYNSGNGKTYPFT